MIAAFVLAALSLLLACGGSPPTPADEVRAFVGEIERASREKDVGALKDAVSQAYADRVGRTREDIHSLIMYHHFRNPQVFLLTRIESLAFASPDRGTLALLAAMAAGPIADLESLREPRADVYRFELEIADEGSAEWRVLSADWRPATLDDLL